MVYEFVFITSVGGGELFDRIIDENHTLMELDAVVFIRQICEGLQHMHKMSILHLDLKVIEVTLFVVSLPKTTLLHVNLTLFFTLNLSQKTFSV